MEISKIDKNFATGEAVIPRGTKEVVLPSDNIGLYGIKYDEEKGFFGRMDYETAEKVSYNVKVLSTTTAGGRARFSTDSKVFYLSVKYKYLAKMTNMPLSGSSGFSLIDETDGVQKLVAAFRPKISDETGFTAETPLKGEGVRDYVLYFPLYNDYITEVRLAFDKESVVTKGKKYDFDLPILYYGSSITQGGCCSRPDNCYQAYISKWHNADYINLGFSGSAKAESEMLEYLASIKSLIFVCDYDHNAPDVGFLKATHINVYNAYRKKNPDTPIIFMSKPDFDGDEAENLRRIKIIRRTYDIARKSGDKNVYFIDGRKLFGKKDRENCTSDGCHPNDLGFYRMAEELDKVIAKLLNK